MVVRERIELDGVHYLGILQCREKKDRLEELSHWKDLTKAKRKYLRLFLRCRLASRFNRCRQWESLWPGMRIGVLHVLQSSKCNQEFNSYIGCIYDFFYLLSDKGSRSIDRLSIQLMESRCPHYSNHDKSVLRADYEERRLFGSVNDEAVREQMWRVLCKYDKLVPSFYTLFEDLKLIHDCREILRKLILRNEPLKGQLCDEFRKIFDESCPAKYQRPGGEFHSYPPDRQLNPPTFNYRQLWLAVLRLWPRLSSHRPLKDLDNLGKSDPRQIHEEGLKAWNELAWTAINFGFRSDAIKDLCNAPISPLPEKLRPLTTTNEGDILEVKKRTGFPYDYPSLDGLWFYHTAANPSAGLDITSLFVGRTLFKRIFAYPSHLSPPAPLMDEQSSHVDNVSQGEPSDQAGGVERTEPSTALTLANVRHALHSSLDTPVASSQYSERTVRPVRPDSVATSSVSLWGDDSMDDDGELDEHEEPLSPILEFPWVGEFHLRKKRKDPKMTVEVVLVGETQQFTIIILHAVLRDFLRRGKELRYEMLSEKMKTLQPENHDYSGLQRIFVGRKIDPIRDIITQKYHTTQVLSVPTEPVPETGHEPDLESISPKRQRTRATPGEQTERPREEQFMAEWEWDNIT